MARILAPDPFGGRLAACTRALARAGDECHVAWSYARGKLQRRRWLKGRNIRQVHAVASAESDPEAYVRDVRALCARLKVDVLMPFAHSTSGLLCHHAGSFAAPTRHLLPAPEAFDLADDKLRFARYAEALGLDCPQSFEIGSEDDAVRIAREIRYPVAVKARGGSGVASGQRFANSAEELRRGYAELVDAGESEGGARGPVMVQEFVPGYIHDVCALAVRGDVLQTLTQLRKLMYPISGGVGAVVFTTRNPELERSARRLLESLEWNGPAQVEFKLDPRDGRFKLIEMNPRFWGTLPLSLCAGIDFPRMLRDHVLGEPVPRDRPYAVGVRYRFLFSRGLLALRQLRRTAGIRALRDPQRYARTWHDWDPRDPLPDLVRAAGTLSALARGREIAVDPRLSRAGLNRLDRCLPHDWPESAAERVRLLSGDDTSSEEAGRAARSGAGAVRRNPPRSPA